MAAIRRAAKQAQVSAKTIKRFLYKYLAYQDKRILATKPICTPEVSEYAKVFKSSLNKYYFSFHSKNMKQSKP